MADNVGVICGAETGRIFAVINPDDDSELDNPRWLLIQVEAELREPVSLIKILMSEYMTFTSFDQLQAVTRQRLGLV